MNPIQDPSSSLAISMRQRHMDPIRDPSSTLAISMRQRHESDSGPFLIAGDLCTLVISMRQRYVFLFMASATHAPKISYCPLTFMLDILPSDAPKEGKHFSTLGR